MANLENATLIADENFHLAIDISNQGKWVQPINWEPDNPESYKLARSWVDECIAEHDHGTLISNVAGVDCAPVRVLHIEKSPTNYELRLVPPENSEAGGANFVALSYCWGGDQPHKLTKAKMRETQGVMDYNKLPSTIQDAVRVTFGLGFQHLWIDSLCIVQDDQDELVREIAKMSFIYSRAVLTISAKSAAAASDGFLNRRASKDALYVSNVSLETDDGAVTDRPVAISGVVDAIDRLTNHRDIYVAGHWRMMLPDDLLWGNEGLKWCGMKGRELYERPVTFQGPSWSWTSVNSLVAWHKFSKPAQDEALGWKLLNHQVTLVNEQAPFGAVREAALTMSARTLQVEAEIDNSTGKPLRTADGAPEMMKRYLELWADCQPSLDGQQKPLTLALARGRIVNFDEAWGLVLQEVDLGASIGTIKTYTRWGIFKSSASGTGGELNDWFKRWPREEFKLI
ncbi:hypothetical protein N0V90_007104 [Kalmusia sp. IMI 367209]|nr:hypothetical protein N0V90_007104 [Kalmusia sp. IMI 367209]